MFYLTTQLIIILSCDIQIKLMDPRPYHYEYRKPRLSNPTYKSDHLYQSIYHFGAYGKVYPNMDKIPNNSSSPQGFQINPERFNKQKQVQAQINQQIKQIDPYIQDLRQYNARPEQAKQQQKAYVKNNNNNNGDLDFYRYPSMENPRNENINQREPLYRPSSELQRANYARDQANQNINMRRNSSETRSYSQDTPNGRGQQQQGAYMSGYGSKLLLPIPRRGDQDAVYQRQQKHYNIINCYPKQVFNTHRNYPKYTLQNKLIEAGQLPYYQNPQNQRNY